MKQVSSPPLGGGGAFVRYGTFNREGRLSQNLNFTWAATRYEAFNREWASIRPFTVYLLRWKPVINTATNGPLRYQGSYYRNLYKGNSVLKDNVVPCNRYFQLRKNTLILNQDLFSFNTSACLTSV